MQRLKMHWQYYRGTCRERWTLKLLWSLTRTNHSYLKIKVKFSVDEEEIIHPFFNLFRNLSMNIIIYIKFDYVPSFYHNENVIQTNLSFIVTSNLKKNHSSIELYIFQCKLTKARKGTYSRKAD